MYEELISSLRICQEMCEAARFEEAAKLLTQATDAIEKLQKASEEAYNKGLLEGGIAQRAEDEKWLPKWIPVTERLPEIDEKHHCSKDVLVYLDGGYMAFSALEENIFGQTWFECERHPDVEEEMVVTHWMPLPSTEGLNET